MDKNGAPTPEDFLAPTQTTSRTSTREEYLGTNGTHIELPREFSEFDFGNLLADRLPPIKTVGSLWYAFANGTWAAIDRATLRPAAQAILPEGMRTARREATLLDHLEGRFQVSADAFRGFYRFDEEGAILLNVGNGIVRAMPGGELALLPHADHHLFTQQAAAIFQPAATAPLFERILTEALPDLEDRELYQLCAGNFLWPDCRHETALVCFGGAGTGKSTLADPIAATLGGGLIARLSMQQICDPKSYHLTKLRFSAVNLGTELDVVAVDESANFKTLVSGEPVEARPIYGAPVTVQSACKLWFLANGLPRFKNGTEAELRRTRFLRFDYRPAEKDVTLKNRLLAERDGVFNWMLAGLQRLFALPEIPLGGVSSRQVHERFRVSNDPLGAFVAQHCILDPDRREEKGCLQSAFGEFCEEQGLPVACGDWFLKRLYERFTALRQSYRRLGDGRVRMIEGISLKERL